MSDRSSRKVREGVVVSDKMQNTVVVQIERSVMHPTYKRYVRQRRKYHVHYDASALGHDGDEVIRMGDRIRFTETRPISKTKCWRFLEYVERSK